MGLEGCPCDDILDLIGVAVETKRNQQNFASVLAQLTETYHPEFDDRYNDDLGATDAPPGQWNDGGIKLYLEGKYYTLFSEKSFDKSWDFWKAYDQNYENQYENSPRGEDYDY